MMKRHKEPGWQITDEHRERLHALLADLPADAGKSDPRFVALLDGWEKATEGASYRDAPTVHAYRTKGGGWLVDAPNVVRAQIGEAAGVPFAGREP